jgi:rhodanese-related sulfurtransferase
MITQLPIGQIIVITITSIVLSLILNVVRPDGIPLLAKELAVAEEIEYDAATEPRLLAITLEQALDLYQKGTVFVDAREPEYYQEGHIKGAWNIPFFLELVFKLDSLQGKDAPLVIYCSGDECGSSEDLAYELQGEGFSNLLVFKGGWTAWNSSGHPIEP